MPRRYYRVLDDMAFDGRWFLASPVDARGRAVDPRRFTAGGSVREPGSLSISLRVDGAPMDFTLADFDMPVATAALGARLAALAPGAVQRFPVTVDGLDGAFEILNVTRAVRCFDEAASDIQYVTEDAVRPERVGTYEMVVEAVIDPALAGDERLFRVEGWRVMLVCDGDVRDALAAEGYSGLRFEELAVSRSGA
jgi:hypothetical protein